MSADNPQPTPPPRGHFLVYQTEDGRLKIDVRLEGETAWLTQAHMATLFQTTVPNVNMHLRNIFSEGELQPGSVVQQFLITAACSAGAVKDKVLFLDARHIFRQIDRAHREFTPEQVEFLANIVRLYRGHAPEFERGSQALLKEKFPKLKYVDVPGLCKAATRKEIETQGWSLNPGRYVGVAPGEEVSDADFMEQFEKLTEQLETLNAEARELEERIVGNAAKILET